MDHTRQNSCKGYAHHSVNAYRYAFVEFETEDSAKRALDGEHNKKLRDREIYITVCLISEMMGRSSQRRRKRVSLPAGTASEGGDHSMAAMIRATDPRGPSMLEEVVGTRVAIKGPDRLTVLGKAPQLKGGTTGETILVRRSDPIRETQSPTKSQPLTMRNEATITTHPRTTSRSRGTTTQGTSTSKCDQ